MSNKNNTETKDTLVWIGPIPIDPDDRMNKFLLLSVNGKTIMLERGRKHEGPAAFAEAYEHRIAMQNRRIRNRTILEEELFKKQSSEGVSFM